MLLSDGKVGGRVGLAFASVVASVIEGIMPTDLALGEANKRITASDLPEYYELFLRKLRDLSGRNSDS